VHSDFGPEEIECKDLIKGVVESDPSSLLFRLPVSPKAPVWLRKMVFV
jgi:hypothetical protein